jgi:hypothetical protein
LSVLVGRRGAMNPAGSADCNFTRTDFLRVFVIFFVTDERLQSGE